ncbi:hypothetical protein Agub_g4514 [Astrephomene gubernaculifera]|uniref:Uncharacterized protein n=1 Tax=Astrephomene gubernaculifera TaxID=47775 RepID=A0AAD3DMQ8_9CHLO|nr:hypothetical protein Agub_g4514 [Astrephomene gubernaculifera]
MHDILQLFPSFQFRTGDAVCAGILPLENMCEAVAESVDQLMKMEPAVRDLVASYDWTPPATAAGATATAAVQQGEEGHQHQEQGQMFESSAAAPANGHHQLQPQEQQSVWSFFGGGSTGSGNGVFTMPSDRC